MIVHSRPIAVKSVAHGVRALLSTSSYTSERSKVN